MSKVGGIRVLESRRNELLRRTEYVVEVDNADGGTVSRSQARSLLTTALDAKSENLIVVKVWTPAGRDASRIVARVYDDRETLMRVEPKHLLIRDGFLERPKRG